MRLDRLVATQLATTRNAATRMIREGRVIVDGQTRRRPAEHVDPDTVELLVDGEEVTVRAELTLLLHKPAGLVSATTDRHASTVFSLVPEQLRRRGLSLVGRLDVDTTGLLVLTTDGALNHRLTHPRRHVARVYRAVIEGAALLSTPVEDVAARFREGIELRDGTRCRPAGFAWRSPGVAEIVLHEGRYHQVKRMVAASGGRVVALHREAIGALRLPADLGAGDLREATAAEVAALLSSAPITTGGAGDGGATRGSGEGDGAG